MMDSGAPTRTRTADLLITNQLLLKPPTTHQFAPLFAKNNCRAIFKST
jgi:hypothetical protein